MRAAPALSCNVTMCEANVQRRVGVSGHQVGGAGVERRDESIAAERRKALAPFAATPPLDRLTSLFCAPGAASMLVTNTSVIAPLRSRPTRSVATLEYATRRPSALIDGRGCHRWPRRRWRPGPPDWSLGGDAVVKMSRRLLVSPATRLLAPDWRPPRGRWR